jgi:hypothetical protein
MAEELTGALDDWDILTDGGEVIVDDKDPETDNTKTETDGEKITRLEVENKTIKDGNSKLGREFKAYKEDNNDQYNALLDRITDMTVPPADQATPIVNEYEDEDDKRVAAIAIKTYKEGEEKKVAINKKYVDDYSKAMQALGKNEDAGVYESILAEVEGMAGFSEDGAEDALRHYQKGGLNYYRKQAKQTSAGNSGNPAFREQVPSGVIGGASTTVAKESVDTTVTAAEQDPAVQDYMKWRNRKKGNDPEFLKRAISHETQLSSGKVRI